VIAAVSPLGLGCLLGLALEVSAGQIVEQNVELRTEQVLPALPQVREQLLLVLAQTVQATVQPVLFRGRKIHPQ